jgi:heme/copper-type cytochrome/quinol oxidase subunit 3
MADPVDRLDPDAAPGADPGAVPSQLRHLRAAQLRARVVRGALVRLAFGTVFLIGAIAHALSPERHSNSSVLWMTLLSLMSTVNVGLGLRALARLRRPRWRQWIPAAGAWGLLSVVLLALLLRR